MIVYITHVILLPYEYEYEYCMRYEVQYHRRASTVLYSLGCLVNS